MLLDYLWNTLFLWLLVWNKDNQNLEAVEKKALWALLSTQVKSKSVNKNFEHDFWLAVGCAVSQWEEKFQKPCWAANKKLNS